MQKHLTLPNRFSEHCVQRTQQRNEELKFNEVHRSTVSVKSYWHSVTAVRCFKECTVSAFEETVSAELFKTASLHRTQPCDD